MSTILIVDNNPAFLEPCGTLLRQGGHAPLFAREGWEAMEQLRSNSPDLVILNLELPIAIGRSLFSQLRTLSQRPPVLTLAAFGSWFVKEERHVMDALIGGDDPVDLASALNDLVASTSYWPRR